jgi:hypothetical protein
MQGDLYVTGIIHEENPAPAAIADYNSRKRGVIKSVNHPAIARRFFVFSVLTMCW